MKVLQWFSLALLSGSLGAAAPLGAQTPLERGKKLFNLCAQCHGDGGAGNHKIAAPAIAGLEGWYIEAQLHKFHDGARGKHPRDEAGNRMRPMAFTLKSNDSGDDIAAVASYVASLSKPSPEQQTLKQMVPATLVGNPSKGREQYAVCVACHGDKGQGNVQMKAPGLVQLDDWYMLTQLKHFKEGVRGADPAKDPQGALMVPMAKNLADEQAMLDVVSYIKSLGGTAP